MKIKSVQSIIVDNFRTNWVFAIVTLEDGTRGIGESTLIGTEKAVASLIDLWAERLVGKSVLDGPVIQSRMQRESYWLTGPVMSAALAAVDTAIWDARARVLGVPLYVLLGGRAKESQPVYANGWFIGARKPAEFAEKAKKVVDQGFRAMKWDPFGSAYRTMRRPEIEASIECVAAVRDAVGKDIDLMIEAHGRFDLNTGIEIARYLPEFRVSWFEEPIPPGRPLDMAQLRRSVNVPIAAGERCYSRFDVAALLEAQAVDVVQADVAHIGGVTEMQHVHGLCESSSIPIAPHNPNGPICNAAQLHAGLAWEAVTWLEVMVTDVPWRREIFQEPCKLVDGALTIDDRPGLGVDFDLEAAAKYPYQEHQLRHFSGKLTNFRPPDAVAWYQKEGS